MKLKKKLVSLGLAAALTTTAIVGGTMAYFTDTDQADNTFTAGGVAIQLIEQERGDGGLVPFTQNQVLLPIVGSAQGEKDALGMPVAANYVDKIVTIKNTASSDAWVRAYFAIPAALDDGYETFNAGANILHFNFGNDNGETTYQNQWNWHIANGKWKYREMMLDNVHYNVYYADYYQPLAAGATTEQFVSGVYLDKNVDMKDGKYIDHRFPNADLSILEGTVKCPVFAVAVQAAGFDNADAAVTAAFGQNFLPWTEATPMNQAVWN